MIENIKLILKSVRQYKKAALITPLFMIGEAGMECAMPFIMGYFVDGIKRITTPNDFFSASAGNIPVFYLAIILIVMAIISLLCGIFG